jgi:polysaccharide biosynthesis protein PslH
MKILLISRCPPYPLHLGDRLIVYHLAEELEGRKHDLDLIAFVNQPEDWHEQDKYDMYFNHVELIAEPRRTPADYLRRQLVPGSRFPRRADESWSPEMWRAIERRLMDTEYDAIHLFGGITVYEYFHALGGRPAIITPYESYSLYLRRMVEAENTSVSQIGKRIATRFQWRLARAFERWMFTPYRHAVVVSPRDREELLSINPTLKVNVIPNGVDTYYFRARPTERTERALLFTGNYEYAPNVDAALRLAHDVLPRVRARLPDVKLWLVGNAPPAELLALASDDIKVTGRVPDVRPYLARAAAFVSPLRLGAGIKNKVLEALAMGCPVVATPLSVDGIDVRDGQDALIADGDALIDAVVRLLGDETLQKTLSDNGPKLIAAQYSWGRVVEMYEALYETLDRP